MDDKYWMSLENLFVHYVYDEISPHYDRDQNPSNQASTETKKLSNNTAWRKVKNFILELDENSLIADIGCGNGKYLQLNHSIYTLGCDICKNLVNIAADSQTSNKNQLVVCDNLNLPFRLESNF